MAVMCYGFCSRGNAKCAFWYSNRFYGYFAHSFSCRESKQVSFRIWAPWGKPSLTTSALQGPWFGLGILSVLSVVWSPHVHLRSSKLSSYPFQCIPIPGAPTSPCLAYQGNRHVIPATATVNNLTLMMNLTMSQSHVLPMKLYSMLCSNFNSHHVY